MTQRRLFIATASGMAGAGDLDQAMALRANAQAATTTTNAASGACCARCGKPKP